MIAKPFEPTDEQQRVIEHAGSAFITACPGAGKTRVMVERARTLLGGKPTGRGISSAPSTRSSGNSSLRRSASMTALPSRD
jgi:hypothetical protein